jgi:hypothetical protein
MWPPEPDQGGHGKSPDYGQASLPVESLLDGDRYSRPAVVSPIAGVPSSEADLSERSQPELRAESAEHAFVDPAPPHLSMAATAGISLQRVRVIPPGARTVEGGRGDVLFWASS